jgi:hypothetical protein
MLTYSTSEMGNFDGSGGHKKNGTHHERPWWLVGVRAHIHTRRFSNLQVIPFNSTHLAMGQREKMCSFITS